MPFSLRPSGMRKSFRTYSHFSHNGNSDLQLLMRLLICLLISTIYSAGKALDLTIVIPSCKSSFRLSCGTYSGSEWRLHISKRIRLLMALKLSSKAVRIMQRLRTMRAFLSACNFSYHSIFGGSYTFSKMRFWTPIK